MRKNEDIDELFNQLNFRNEVLTELKRELNKEYHQLLIDSGRGFEQHESHCNNCGTDNVVDGLDIFHMGLQVEEQLVNTSDGSFKFILSSCKHCMPVRKDKME